MLAHQITIIPQPAQIIFDNNLIGRQVYVDTLFYGQQVGIIEKVRPTPFYGESGLVAFVVGADKFFTDYIYLDELLFVEDSCTCCDCGYEYKTSMMCDECGFCLGCCSCEPSWLDDPDFEDYADTGEDYEYDSYKDDKACRH